jgi:hypothetical protein
MGLLQKAKVEQAAAKVGVFASQGAGKTTTALLMAIGLSKTYHNSAPIAFMDTENGSDYVVPIADLEGVELQNFKSRAFKDMRTGLKEAEAAGCCVYIVDSYTHPWKELVDSFKAKSNRKKLEFHHMDQLKTIWQGWTDAMLNSPLHVILAGRLGYVWDREADEEDGTKGDLIKLGTKMKSESEAGYEPSLLIEMEGIQTEASRQKKTRAKQGSIVHHAYVLKDRWRILNGRTFTFKDMNEYKVGGYQPVFNAFRPHFDKLAIGKAEQRSVDPSRTSAELFSPSGESVGAQMARRQTIAAEEVAGILSHLWPGQTAAEKRIRQSVLHELFGTFSWHAVETAPVVKLENVVDILREFKSAAEHNPPATAENAVKVLKDIQRELYGEPAEAAEAPAEGVVATTAVGTVAAEEALAI